MYALDQAILATPIGAVRLEGDDAALHRIQILGEPAAPRAGSAAAVRDAIEQLEQWFTGERRDFALALAPAKSVRGQALRDGMAAIGYGETLSYGGLARVLGSGPRAIGQACARNPFPIVIPCHRVLGAGDSIGHYSAGGGIATKQWLLDHERRYRERNA